MAIIIVGIKGDTLYSEFHNVIDVKIIRIVHSGATNKHAVPFKEQRGVLIIKIKMPAKYI